MELCPGLNTVKKTVKLTVIHKSMDKIYENLFIYLFVRKAPPKLRKLRKLQIFLKTAKFTVIRKSMDKIYEIYLFGYKEDPSKVAAYKFAKYI